ncbi:MAG: YggS family pyridoxal phosphate-dependent enzyme [Prevotellaceae bacterium]|jgi:pyridoxal phosphate enzyme (YggS family)|nr:YggS family pyridoxal phosphate-dependent enzyme [Prevotellaceae bacterium]
MLIAENIQEIQQELPAQVRLVAVSKTYSAEAVMEAYSAGQRDFGESRPQELQLKASMLPSDIRWHFIGHLQSNKVKMVLPHAHLIHSVDSEKLLREVNDFCKKNNAAARCLLQVHVAQESTKFGFLPDELMAFLRTADWENLSHVTPVGLMAMATYTSNVAQVRSEFRQVKQLFEQAKLLAPQADLFTEISMGMSNDYRIAMEEGATLIRVGTSIFGER